VREVLELRGAGDADEAGSRDPLGYFFSKEHMGIELLWNIEIFGE
jgi:hypothetical protein